MHNNILKKLNLHLFNQVEVFTMLSCGRALPRTPQAFAKA
jgi:hypothetical protein